MEKYSIFNSNKYFKGFKSKFKKKWKEFFGKIENFC